MKYKEFRYDRPRPKAWLQDTILCPDSLITSVEEKFDCLLDKRDMLVAMGKKKSGRIQRVQTTPKQSNRG
jgi:hypothetical protein